MSGETRPISRPTESKPLHLLSRRAMLRRISMVPAVVTLSAVAQAQIAEASEQAATHCELTDPQKVKLERVVGRMWRAFQRGVLTEADDRGGVAKGLSEGVVLAAFALSGNHVIKDLGGFDDTTGDDTNTMNCAKICGCVAAALATSDKITPPNFRVAWAMVQKRTGAVYDRCKQVNNLKEADLLGYGC